MVEALGECDDGNPWYYDIKNYLETGTFPPYASSDDGYDCYTVRRNALKFVLLRGVLYKKSFQGVLLRSVEDDEAVKIQYEAHNIVCEGHVNGQILAKKIYYWPMIERDYVELVRSCHSCQLHANKIQIYLDHHYIRLSQHGHSTCAP